jgi:MOSC domain-containing protein YiiM
MSRGTVVAVYLCADRGLPLIAVPEVRAVVGKGLEGDRYFLNTGSMSRWPGAGRSVSLIAEEVIEDVLTGFGLDLRDGRSRRNVVTRGVDPNALIGRDFRIGTALFRGVRACDPCGYLERRIGPGLMEALRGRGGLRADVLEDGVIRPGDAVG